MFSATVRKCFFAGVDGAFCTWNGVFCDCNRCFLRRAVFSATVTNVVCDGRGGEACSGGVRGGSAVFSAAVGAFCDG